MTTRDLFARPWVRIVLLFWGVLFPIIFVALPLIKVVTGEAEFEMTTLWALLLWVLSPLAVSVLLKYLGVHAAPKTKETNH